MTSGQLISFLNGALKVVDIRSALTQAVGKYKNSGKAELTFSSSRSSAVSLSLPFVLRLLDSYVAGEIDKDDTEYLSAAILDCKDIDHLPTIDSERDLLRLIVFFAVPDSSFPVSVANAQALKRWAIERSVSKS